MFLLNCFATLLAIAGYRIHKRKNPLARKVVIKIASKDYSKKLDNERKNIIEFYEKMPKEEKIEILESFIKTLEDNIERAKKELEELRNGE